MDILARSCERTDQRRQCVIGCGVSMTSARLFRSLLFGRRNLVCGVDFVFVVFAFLMSLNLIANSQVTTTTNTNPAQDSPSNRLVSRATSEHAEVVDNGIDLSAPEDTIYEPESEDEPVDWAESRNKSNKFTWNHHHDDHGIYAGRSLLSANSLRSESSENSVDQDDAIGADGTRRPGPPDLDPLSSVNFAEREWQLMFRAFDMLTDTAGFSMLTEVGRQTNLFADIIEQLRPECQRDIRHIVESVKKHKIWALRMVDSNGKLPSGVTYGRFSSPGDYEECLSVQVDERVYRDVARNLSEEYKFHGKYCLLDFRLPLPERPTDRLLGLHEPVLNFSNTEFGAKYADIIANYSAYASVFYDIGYLHAFCLPSSCDVHELAKSMTRSLEGTFLIVNNTIDCEERPLNQPKPLRTSQIISLAIMAVIFTNLFIASAAYHLAERRQRAAYRKQRREHKSTMRGANGDNEKQSKLAGDERAQESISDSTGVLGKLSKSVLSNRFYLDCFSIQKNFERLTKPDPRGLTFVHYTRIVAMGLTVITHTAALGTLQAITKPADASNSEQIFRDFIPQMLANSFSSIQVFFFMAGFMLVLSTYPSIKRDKGHISFAEYAIKRAIRLMPGLAATICLNFLWPLVVDGPMLSFFVRAIMVPCETNWWHTLGFISNYDHVEKMCLRHSYFSASDYQLHIMAFPLLILLHKQPGLALALAGLLTVAGFVAQVIMVLTKIVLPFMMVDYVDKNAFFNVIHYIHHPVWNHMSAFFYGFIVGYMVVRQVRLQLSPLTIKRLWYIVMPAGVASIFAPYFWNHYKRPVHRWQSVLYVIFDRLILLTCCAWVSYAPMVLARKPASRKPTHEAPASVASGESEKQKASASLATFVPPPAPSEPKPTLTDTAESSESTNISEQLAAPADTPTLRRQRSSPDFLNLQTQHEQQPLSQPQQQQDSPSAERAAASANSLNLGLPAQRRPIRTVSSGNLPTIAEQAKDLGETAGPTAPSGGAPEQRKRIVPPVSNMNTLCLALSRLTFQLYLFNMVVLWVDVNHSKYYWFFSYYFIIIKASAVYICSAIMATIFFIALESPSLTLYIAWVKSRAAARAKRRVVASTALQQQQQQQQFSETKLQPLGSLNKLVNNIPTESIISSPTMAASTRPNFSFIDLSSSPATQRHSSPPQPDHTRM